MIDEQRGPVNVDVSDNDSVSSLMKPSVRNFYGKDESVYIMDAKAAGNIGRYLNVRLFLFIIYTYFISKIHLVEGQINVK